VAQTRGGGALRLRARHRVAAASGRTRTGVQCNAVQCNRIQSNAVPPNVMQFWLLVCSAVAVVQCVLAAAAHSSAHTFSALPKRAHTNELVLPPLLFSSLLFFSLMSSRQEERERERQPNRPVMNNNSLLPPPFAPLAAASPPSCLYFFEHTHTLFWAPDYISSQAIYHEP